MHYQPNAQLDDCSCVDGNSEPPLSHVREYIAFNDNLTLPKTRFSATSVDPNNSTDTFSQSNLSGWPSFEISRLDLPSYRSITADLEKEYSSTSIESKSLVEKNDDLSSAPQLDSDFESAASLFPASEIDEIILNEWVVFRLSLHALITYRYFRIYHPVTPYLSTNRQALRLHLGRCHESLRHSFSLSLGCAVRSSPYTSINLEENKMTNAEQLEIVVSKSYKEIIAGNNQRHNGILYIQILISVVIFHINRGASDIKLLDTAALAEWLGRIAGILAFLKFETVRSCSSMDDQEIDSDEKLSRRIFWTVFVLDRWQALGTSRLPQIPEFHAVLSPEDESVLGKTLYQIAR